MSKNLRWRTVLVLVVVAVFAWGIYPPEKRIRLGLDLKGGIHLVLKVRKGDAVSAEISDAAQRLKERLRTEKILFQRIGTVEGENAFQATGIPQDKHEALRKLAADWFPDYEIRPGDPWVFVLRGTVERAIQELAVRQAKETIENRVNQFGLTEPVVQVQGEDRILVQIPGIDDPVRVKGLIQKTAFLELRKVEGGSAPSEEALLQQSGGTWPPDTETLPEEDVDPQTGAKFVRYYRVHKGSIVTGRDLRNARTGQDDQGLPAVHFYLKPDGARRFRRATKEIIDSGVRQQICIVLDGQIKSAPFVNDVISDAGIIEGNFTQEEAQDLSLVLRAGALPAGMDLLEERTVGPSLGIDSIRQGVAASLLGLALVVLFMLVYYRFSGLNALIALMLNIIILLGAMAFLKASMTLPGIAGVILTIGMAVDANVLIFERIREELTLGKTAKSAMAGGFAKAFWTIFDSNLTTLIAAVFLFQFGTGAIKGFAVSLTIGLMASMFTAIFVSRVIFEHVLGRKGARTDRISI